MSRRLLDDEHRTAALRVGRPNSACGLWLSAEVNFLAPFVSTDSLSTTRAGWTVGAGIEYGITSNWTTKGRRERKKIEMRFAHLKRILKLGRLRVRGPRGAQDEFILAAIAQNLRRLVTLVARPPPIRLCASRSVGIA